MILNTITLHNFMSYSETTVDLTSFSIACLSGLNGAGKSAILDAVTWALWESARAGSDDLIRSTEQEMWVDLIFELEGVKYRVRRARSRAAARPGGKPISKGTLDFQIWSGESWTSLTCASMRETQTRICELLRMDYDTFINSVYLRQGRADEFTTRPPAERKQVLSEILGLNYFDKLQELAREEAKRRKVQSDVMQAALRELKSIPEQLESTSKEFTAVAQKLQTLCEEIEENDAKLALYRLEINELASLQSRLEPTQSRLSELVSDLVILSEQRSKLAEKKSAYQAIIDSARELEAAAAEFATTKKKVERLDNINLERQEFETKRLELKSALANIRGRMEVEIEHLATQLESVLATKKGVEKDLAQKDKIEREHNEYRKLVAEEAEMARRQEAYIQLSKRAEQLHTIIVESRIFLEAELEQKQQALLEWESLIKSRESVLEQQELLHHQSDELDKLEAEFDLVEENGLKVKQDIDAIALNIAGLEKRLSENAQKVHELQHAESLTMCPLCAAPIVDRLAVVERYAGLDAEVKKQIDELTLQSDELEKKRDALRERYVELRRRLDARKRLDVQIGELNARLSALERADANHARLAAEIKISKDKLQNQTFAALERESLISIKAEIHKLEFDPILYSSLQAQLRSQRHVEVRYQQMKRDLTQLDKLEQEIPKMRARIEKLQSDLHDDCFGAETRAEIDQLSERLAAFHYDRTEHQVLKQRLGELLPLADRFKELEQAQAQLPATEQELSAVEQQIAAKSSQQKTLSESISVWQQKLSARGSLTKLMEETEARLSSLLRDKQELGRQVAVLELRTEQLQLEHSGLLAKQEQLNTLIAETNDYEFLSEAFGKKGIQAIIIENAVPEIEVEANNILSRLSENQMHVALVTQQRTKAGHLVEALDIVVADSIGTRNYELYSGGEAFKINFAIRVALSRLLARRAGAKLQSLIVDEGFGSQDEASRGRLIKALNAIKPDFARILVVTHISEIKEMFPVQIHVQKNNGVSSVNLVHAY